MAWAEGPESVIRGHQCWAAVVGKEGTHEEQCSGGSGGDRKGAQVRDGWRMEGGCEEDHRGKSGPYPESSRVAEEEGHMGVADMDASVGVGSRNGSEGEEGHGPEGIVDDTGEDEADCRNAVVAAGAEGQADRLGIQLVARKGRVSEAILEAVRRDPPEDRRGEAVRSPCEKVESTEEGRGAVLAPRNG